MGLRQDEIFQIWSDFQKLENLVEKCENLKSEILEENSNLKF